MVERWESVLSRLENDPYSCARELDWVAKLRLLEGFRQREGSRGTRRAWSSSTSSGADVRPEKASTTGSPRAGRSTGSSPTSRSTPRERPPEDTRAYFRGRCLTQYGEHVAAASWDSVIFDVPGRGALQRVPTLDPHRGTREHVGALLDRCRTAADLVEALANQ